LTVAPAVASSVAEYCGWSFYAVEIRASDLSTTLDLFAARQELETGALLLWPL
jgi:hypothetical protein